MLHYRLALSSPTHPGLATAAPQSLVPSVHCASALGDGTRRPYGPFLTCHCQVPGCGPKLNQHHSPLVHEVILSASASMSLGTSWSTSAWRRCALSTTLICTVHWSNSCRQNHGKEGRVRGQSRSIRSECPAALRGCREGRLIGQL